ncbi:hypothetical protein B0T25DRAFT_126892 [Lasiosphaeria hispida]|uniref:CCZ1/INTU/HSP4 first Longin domain-containing protein n=1 Tax=Lasiosphaeria hispida TaxID=260671 RepID=A0AAJ0HS81_9PEZI|nr:hypothetical protein B0T25DRAFT_126892 [Lasiosphaeria hispida]
MASTAPSAIVPAQLGFLAIYNPSLGTTDETLDHQIVYYASVTTQTGPRRRRHRSRGPRPTDALSSAERNERLRQIGLAQGMVNFSRSFSSGRSLDTIDTERTRVVLHELEPGWWILASIDLTRLPAPAPPPTPTSPAAAASEEKAEYSSREVKPATLLLQDLLRAHAVFLLHHAPSLSALFVRTQRDRFVGVLGRYWDMFLSTWNVLLHGNPACAVFGGIRIAACGELGMGVGEEERGSGEREVLEGLVGRVEGMVDVVAGRFGEGGAEGAKWLGTGNEPGAEDGAMFLGTGALSRDSLRAVMYWMEDVFTWGEGAYGVADSSSSTRSPSKKRRSSRRTTAAKAPALSVPAPIREEPEPAGSQGGAQGGASSAGSSHSAAGPKPVEEDPSGAGMDKLFSYLKLGYGTSWSLTSAAQTSEPDPIREAAGNSGEVSGPQKPPRDADSGRFLVGLVGDVDEVEKTSEQDDQSSPDQAEDAPNSRILVRTISVELEAEALNRSESTVTKDLGSHDTELTSQRVDTEGRITEAANTSFDSQDRNKTKKLRVIVYVARPFIFIFLFELRTDSLAWEGFYRSLHSQLTPIRKPLLTSTAYRPERPDATAQIYDLVWDPRLLTVHSTIPNIPDPLPAAAGASAAASAAAWSRVEALSTHNQILNIFMSTRENLAEFEATCKTSRGWWVVWNRILDQQQDPSRDEPSPTQSEWDSPGGRDVRGRRLSSSSSEGGEETRHAERGGAVPPGSGHGQEYIVDKEIFLVRRASDNVRAVSYVGAGTGGSVAGGGWADGASRLAQGIGVDTRRYVEGLLSLNR